VNLPILYFYSFYESERILMIIKRWLHFGFESVSNNEKLMALFMDLVSIQSNFKLSLDLETSQNLSLAGRGQKSEAPRNPDSYPPNALAIRV
jgi:hypothetical protein